MADVDNTKLEVSCLFFTLIRYPVTKSARKCIVCQIKQGSYYYLAVLGCFLYRYANVGKGRLEPNEEILVCFCFMRYFVVIEG